MGEGRPGNGGVAARFEETVPVVIGKRKVCMDSLRPCTGKGFRSDDYASNFFLAIDTIGVSGKCVNPTYASLRAPEAKNPPSTAKSTPVVYPASSPTKYITAAATSAVDP